MGTNNQTNVWPCLRYDDAPAAIEFLKKAFGFEEALVVASEDGKDVVHAELRWPLGGGLMLGTTAYRDGVHAQMTAGTGWAYVVTGDPDELFTRAIDAGALEVEGLNDTEFGSRGFTVRDPEGNTWSFGTYSGA
jgi:uncharacterized glyoxalase superfamily protein PhnB